MVARVLLALFDEHVLLLPIQVLDQLRHPLSLFLISFALLLGRRCRRQDLLDGGFMGELVPRQPARGQSESSFGLEIEERVPARGLTDLFALLVDKVHVAHNVHQDAVVVLRVLYVRLQQ